MIKNRKIAKLITTRILECGARLDETTALVKRECSADEFDAFKKVAGRIMGEMLLEVLAPIFKQHPDLKPNRLRKMTSA